MDHESIEYLLEQTRSSDAKLRRAALLELCPCHVRCDVDQVWQRLFQLLTDDDTGVRSIVLHHLTDGSPKSRRDQVVQALEALAQDPDVKLRRRARRAVSEYRRSGRIIEV